MALGFAWCDRVAGLGDIDYIRTFGLTSTQEKWPPVQPEDMKPPMSRERTAVGRAARRMMVAFIFETVGLVRWVS